MKTVATYSIKGGVGKTTTAVNLAYLAARRGRRTLLWDLDPQGAATYIFRIRPRVKGGGERIVARSKPLESAIKTTEYDRLDLLPADFTYRHMDLLLDGTKRPTQQLHRVLQPLRAEYDLVVLDCPPSVSLVSENVLRAADRVLVPLIPSPLSVRTLDQLGELMDEAVAQAGKPPRLIAFFSMVDRRKRLHREIVEDLPRRRGDVAASWIPALSAIEQMAEQRAPLPHYAPRSVAARHYEELAQETLPGR